MSDSNSTKALLENDKHNESGQAGPNGSFRVSLTQSGEYVRMRNDSEKRKRFYPAIGAFYMILSALGMVALQVFAKIMFIKYPQMDPTQMIPLRCVSSILIQLFFTHVNTKKVLWDDITRADAKLLNIRVWFGFIAFSVQIIVIKDLPLVLISLIMNIMPLFTALLGRIFLKEKLTSL